QHSCKDGLLGNMYRAKSTSGTYAGNTNVRIDLLTDALTAFPCTNVRRDLEDHRRIRDRVQATSVKILDVGDALGPREMDAGSRCEMRGDHHEFLGRLGNRMLHVG